MSFLSILKTIEKDVNVGLEVAAGVVGPIDPQLAPILQEIAVVVGGLESIGTTPTATNTSAVVQAVSTISGLKQHVASKQPGSATVTSTTLTTATS